MGLTTISVEVQQYDLAQPVQFDSTSQLVCESSQVGFPGLAHPFLVVSYW